MPQVHAISPQNWVPTFRSDSDVGRRIRRVCLAASLLWAGSGRVWGDEPMSTEATGFFLVADEAPSGAASESTPTGGVIRDLVLKGLAGKRTSAPGTKPEAEEPEIAFELAKGTSSAVTRKQAISEVPLTSLAAANQVRAQAILDEVGYFRRLPTLTVPVVPEVYMHFLNHPDTAASVWRAMNISKLKLSALSDTLFEGDTGDGTTGRMELVYRQLGADGVETLVVLCEGSYKSPLLPRVIQARSMLVLRTKFSKEADGQVFATHRGDVFVSFPSQTVEAVSKVMTPVTAMLSDRTFCEVTIFLKLMSSAMCRRPDWVERVVERMEGVSEERKRELLVLTAQTFVAHNRDALGKELGKPKPGSGASAKSEGSPAEAGSGVRPASAEKGPAERTAARQAVGTATP